MLFQGCSSCHRSHKRTDKWFEVESHEMEVIVYYFNREVARRHVNNPAGCYIYYNNSHSQHQCYDASMAGIFPKTNPSVICIALPQPDPSFNTPSMQRLLESMQLGLLIEMKNNDVYAKQTGLCSMYCNDSRYETTTEGRIRRLEETKVYDFRRLFVSHFERHCAGKGGCPSTEIYFTFGQTWDCERPAEENLLSVVLVHCLARSQVQKRSPHRPKRSNKPLLLEIDDMSDDDELVDRLYDSPFAGQ